MMRRAMHLIAALLCAATIGSAHAGTQSVDGEACIVPGPEYVHLGVQGVDRFAWWWCATRFNRYYSIAIYPQTNVFEAVPDFSAAAKAASEIGFLWRQPTVAPGQPQNAELEAGALAMVTADTVRPPMPRWIVAKNGSSTTRPGYVIADGVRSKTAAAQRVAVGASCSCTERSQRAVEGSAVYCVVPQSSAATPPGLGALCTRVADDYVPPTLQPTGTQ